MATQNSETSAGANRPSDNMARAYLTGNELGKDLPCSPQRLDVLAIAGFADDLTVLHDGFAAQDRRIGAPFTFRPVIQRPASSVHQPSQNRRRPQTTNEKVRIIFMAHTKKTHAHNVFSDR